MSDNTLQFRWIQVLAGNLLAMFAARDDVFVGERRRADRAEERARRLAELFLLARGGEATAEQLADLDRLLNESTGG